MASLWAERTGIAPSQCAVGINPDAPLSAVLLGLRLATCQLEIKCVVAGVDAMATVTHDVLRGHDLRLVVRPRVPRQYSRWIASPSTLAQVRHIAASDGADCLLDEVSISQLRTDDDLDPYMIGTTTLIEIGDGGVASTRWTANLLGAFLPTDRWSGMLANVDVTIDPNEVESSSEGAGYFPAIPSVPVKAIHRFVREATWRRDYVAGDYAQLLRVELQFARSVTVLEAEAFLLDHVCRLLHLFSGARPTLCGVWEPYEQVGRLVDLGRPLLSNRQLLINRNQVTLQRFMAEVAPAWNALPDDRREVVKVAMDALTAMPPDVEPAVVAGAMTLEFLADALLPKSNNGYNLTRAQRKKILAGLTALASTVAPGSTWEGDLARLAPRLFQAPTGDRILALLNAYSIQTSSSERKAYTAVRNSITHGRPSEATFDEKVTTTSFARHGAWSIVMRAVGFTGEVADPRRHRRLPHRPGSRLT